jgi:hypothetical protein
MLVFLRSGFHSSFFKEFSGMFRLVSAITLILAFSVVEVVAAKTPSPKSPLDTVLVHNTYLDGDFDHAIALIEEALEQGVPLSHADSVHIFKHLGVMYAARHETREKGKYYMMQLLQVEPTAKILDMYASDMIYMIYTHVKSEFDASRPHLVSSSRKQDSRPGKEEKQRRYAWVGWTAGLAAAAGGIALAVHLLDEEESPIVEDKTIDVTQ